MSTKPKRRHEPDIKQMSGAITVWVAKDTPE